MFRIGRAIGGTLGSLGGAIGLGIRLANNEDDEEKAEWDREERFILNLTRMSLETDAVFPEHFIEFIVHLTNENYFIKKFEKAKKEENEVFLLAVQKVHRKARLVLDKPGVKDKIKQTIEDRKTASQRKSLFKGFSWMFRYLERYGNSPGSSIFQRTIADVVNNKPLQLLMAPSASSDVVTSPNETLK